MKIIEEDRLQENETNLYAKHGSQVLVPEVIIVIIATFSRAYTGRKVSAKLDKNACTSIETQEEQQVPHHQLKGKRKRKSARKAAKQRKRRKRMQQQPRWTTRQVCRWNSKAAYKRKSSPVR